LTPPLQIALKWLNKLYISHRNYGVNIHSMATCTYYDLHTAYSAMYIYAGCKQSGVAESIGIITREGPGMSRRSTDLVIMCACIICIVFDGSEVDPILEPQTRLHLLYTFCRLVDVVVQGG